MFSLQLKRTLHHSLNHCSEMLERYLWRHNSIINYLYDYIMNSDPNMKNLQVSADIPGLHQGNTTVPVDVTITTLKPDMVLFNKEKKEVSLFELSVPFETNIETTHKIKVERYKKLIEDIEANGFNTRYLPTEVGSRGLITPENQNRLKTLVACVTGKPPPKKLFQDISKIALICSFIIFHSKYEPSWLSPPFVTL